MLIKETLVTSFLRNRFLLHDEYFKSEVMNFGYLLGYFKKVLSQEKVYTVHQSNDHHLYKSDK